MSNFILIALICATLVGELVAQAGRLSSHEWTLFKNRYGKSYESPAEEARRFANFMATKQRIEVHNALGNSSYRVGLNHMADWTREERAKLNGLKVDKSSYIEAQKNIAETEAYLAEILGSSDDPIPNEFDWRKVPGRVSPVGDQGQCGSCWAFSAIGALEGQEIGHTFNKTKQFASLSVQELVDCSSSNAGCYGGLMTQAFDDLKKLGGIESDKDYPYIANDGTCKFNKTKTIMTDAGHLSLPANDENKLKQLLVKYGPIAVSMDADWLAFGDYKSGIYDDWNSCLDSVEGLNHAVLLVGYGVDPKKGDFWIIKNSWGADWGESGYFRMRRGINMCGIALEPVIPKL